jgi:hypothetical protein
MRLVVLEELDLGCVYLRVNVEILCAGSWRCPVTDECWERVVGRDGD